VGILSDYGALERKEKSNLFYADPEVAGLEKVPALPTQIVVLRGVEWRAGHDLPPPTRREVEATFLTHLSRRLVTGLPEDTIFLESEERLKDYEAFRPHTIMVDAAITEAKDGTGVARYLIGFGAGDAILRAEIRAVHSAIPEKPYEASLRVRSNGSPWFGLNPRVFSGRYTLKKAAVQAGNGLGLHLLERIGEPPSQWWKK